MCLTYGGVLAGSVFAFDESVLRAIVCNVGMREKEAVIALYCLIELRIIVLLFISSTFVRARRKRVGVGKDVHIIFCELGVRAGCVGV